MFEGTSVQHQVSWLKYFLQILQNLGFTYAKFLTVIAETLMM
jgi:hypothetical protein